MIQKLLNETIGGLQVLLRHKEIYTALVHTNQPIDTPIEELDTQIIKMVEETPKFPIDFEMFSFTKTFCDAEFTTGNQILQFNDNMWPELYKSKKEFQEIKNQEFLVRKNFVISKKLSPLQIQTHPFFKMPNFTNFITINPNIQESKVGDFGIHNKLVLLKFIFNSIYKIIIQKKIYMTRCQVEQEKFVQTIILYYFCECYNLLMNFYHFIKQQRQLRLNII